MRIDVITIFPDYLAPLHLSLVGKAISRGDVELNVHDLRDFTNDRHNTVDDSPFGGGPGMVMMAQPWGRALDSVLDSGQSTIRPTLLIPTPSGDVFGQASAAELALEPWLIFACGRYEGIDARVAQAFQGRCNVRELSIGDYVLAGGEAPVLVITEAVIRLLPGVLGNSESAPDDSFAPSRGLGKLEGPVYTRPASWRGLDVPEILLRGNHGAIATWRREQSVARTHERRPDLVDPSG